MKHRELFVAAVERRLGAPVLWGAKGQDVFDCSGLVTCCLLEAGGPDLRHVDNAQALYNATRALLGPGLKVGDAPIAGDLAFYGHTGDSIIHVAVVDAFGGVVSADGATSHITSLQVAIANPANRVRRHASVAFRRDVPYCVVHRNTLVDELDRVTH